MRAKRPRRAARRAPSLWRLLLRRSLTGQLKQLTAQTAPGLRATAAIGGRSGLWREARTPSCSTVCLPRLKRWFVPQSSRPAVRPRLSIVISLPLRQPQHDLSCGDTSSASAPTRSNRRDYFEVLVTSNRAEAEMRSLKVTVTSTRSAPPSRSFRIWYPLNSYIGKYESSEVM